MPAIFQPQIAKNQQGTLSVRVIVICSDHILLWRDSYRGFGRASTLPESKLHKVIIIIIAKTKYILARKKPRQNKQSYIASLILDNTTKSFPPHYFKRCTLLNTNMLTKKGMVVKDQVSTHLERV